MADGGMANEMVQMCRSKTCDTGPCRDGRETPAVARDDAGAFLAPMLERVEAVIGSSPRSDDENFRTRRNNVSGSVGWHRRVKDMQQPKRRASKREIARGSAECAVKFDGRFDWKSSPSPRPSPLGEGESSAGLVQRCIGGRRVTQKIGGRRPAVPSPAERDQG